MTGIVNLNFCGVFILELYEHLPLDWKKVENGGLPVYHQIRDEILQNFVVTVHEKWCKLGRNVGPALVFRLSKRGENEVSFAVFFFGSPLSERTFAGVSSLSVHHSWWTLS